MKTAKSKLSGLKAFRDMVFVKEDPIEPTIDKASGLTESVVDSINSGKLFIPDTAQYALEKYPYRGEVISVGEKVKIVSVGDRVIFGRLGGMRMNEGGEQFIALREMDILATVD